MDITEFLESCLGEEEAMAHAAAAFYDDADQDGVSWDGHAGTDLNGYTRFWIAPHLGVVNDVASGLHINRHDPARVLREVAAKRAILEDYTTTCRIRDEAAERIKEAQASGQYVAADYELWERANREASLLDGVVRHLLAIYADRPGYQEGWKV